MELFTAEAGADKRQHVFGARLHGLPGSPITARALSGWFS